MALLKANNLSKSFGGIQAVVDFSFDVRNNEILGLIGPNGAGKTTIFNLLTGFYPVDKGEVLFKEENITGLTPHAIVSKGMVRTFQSTEFLYFGYSVFENILMAKHIFFRSGIFPHLLRFSRAKQEEEKAREEALKLVNSIGLDKDSNTLVDNLPHGKQRALGVAIGLAAEPSLLLLDEPMTGMNSEEARYMTELVRAIRSRGITIIMIEHDMRSVMEICDRIVVVNFGYKLCEGRPEEIRRNPDVIEAYLGKRYGTS